MKERLDGASNELKAVEDRRNGERIELKAATEKLMEERGKFENFHRRVDELVQQLMAQSTRRQNARPSRRGIGKTPGRAVATAQRTGIRARASCAASSRSRAKLKLIYASR